MRNKNFRRICALLLSVALMCGILPMTVMADGPSFEDVQYDLVQGTDGTATKNCEVVKPDSDGNILLSDQGTTGGWYVITSDSGSYYPGRVEVSGDVKLILDNDSPFMPDGGVHVGYNEGRTKLTIYKSTASQYGLLLITNLDSRQGCAGIGGNLGETNGTITICGGIINACGYDGAGIGTGSNANGIAGTVTIKGGRVSGFNKASGFGAGIGGGKLSTAAPVVITGGEISATGAYDHAAAGIGSGWNGEMNSITISGGVIKVSGGTGGPGIGSGVIDAAQTTSAKITVTGGHIFARAGQDAYGAKALMSAMPGENGHVYTSDFVFQPDKPYAFYVCDNYSDDMHHDNYATVTADECLAYRWVEITPCVDHNDNDQDGYCDYCFTPVSHVYFFDSQDDLYEKDVFVAKGEKVPRPDTNPVHDGYAFTGWYQFDLDKNNLGLFDFNVPVTDNIVIIAALYESTLVATMCSGNVVFGSGLELQFRMEFTDDLLTNHPNAEVVFIKNDQVVKTVPITNPDLVEDGKSYFRVPVDMREYKTDVYVKVMDGDDEILLVHPDGTTAYENNACKYSVVQYARDVVTNHWDDQKMVNLAAYAVGYCEYVTRFFDYDDLTEYGWYPNIGNFQYTQDKVEKYGVKKTDNNVDGCTGASLNVDFMHINTLRLTFKFDGSHSIGDYSFTVDNKPVQPTDLGNGKYAFYVTDIIAADIVNPHTFTVTRNGTQESFTVTASVMSYALLASQNAKTSDMKQLGIALYCYGEAADAFFNII